MRLSPHPRAVAFIVEALLRAWVDAFTQALENLRDVAAIEPNSLSHLDLTLLRDQRLGSGDSFARQPFDDPLSLNSQAPSNCEDPLVGSQIRARRTCSGVIAPSPNVAANACARPSNALNAGGNKRPWKVSEALSPPVRAWPRPGPRSRPRPRALSVPERPRGAQAGPEGIGRRQLRLGRAAARWMRRASGSAAAAAGRPPPVASRAEYRIPLPRWQAATVATDPGDLHGDGHRPLDVCLRKKR